jgi:hypothetical protein
MELKRFAASALAAVFALSGIGSILVMQQQPRSVDAVELSPADLDPAIRRDDDDATALEVVHDDDSGDGDDATGDGGTAAGNNTGNAGGANTGDGDRTAGDDGTGGGNNTVAAGGANTGDGDRTAGDDGTGGGNNTGGGGNNTGADTRGGDTT